MRQQRWVLTTSYEKIRSRSTSTELLELTSIFRIFKKGAKRSIFFLFFAYLSKGNMTIVRQIGSPFRSRFLLLNFLAIQAFPKDIHLQLLEQRKFQHLDKVLPSLNIPTNAGDLELKMYNKWKCNFPEITKKRYISPIYLLWRTLYHPTLTLQPQAEKWLQLDYGEPRSRRQVWQL